MPTRAFARCYIIAIVLLIFTAKRIQNSSKKLTLRYWRDIQFQDDGDQTVTLATATAPATAFPLNSLGNNVTKNMTPGLTEIADLRKREIGQKNVTPGGGACVTNLTRLVDCRKATSFASCSELVNLESVQIMPVPSAVSTDLITPRIVWHKEDIPMIRAYSEDAGRNPDFLNDTIASISRQNSSEPLSIAVIRDAFTDMNTGRIQTCQGVHIQLRQCFDSRHEKLLVNVSATHIRRFDRIIYLGGGWTRAFFHSVVEKVPRLIMLRDFVRQNPSIPIVMHPQGRKFIVGIAPQISDIPRSRFVFHKTAIYAKIMYTPETTWCGSLQHVKATMTRDAIRSRLTASAPLNATPIDILLLRRNQNGLNNHDELERTLRSELSDNHLVVFDEKSLPKPGLPQFRMFANVKVIVAPHGAGLSNMLAASPDTVIVEFLSKKPRFNCCFMDLAAKLGLEYHPLVMHKHKRNGNVVNASFVASVVRDILERQHSNKIKA